MHKKQKCYTEDTIFNACISYNIVTKTITYENITF